MTTTDLKTIGDELPYQQRRIRECRENGLSIGPAGRFYVMMCDAMLARAARATDTGDVVEMIRVCKEMQEFKE